MTRFCTDCHHYVRLGSYTLCGRVFDKDAKDPVFGGQVVPYKDSQHCINQRTTPWWNLFSCGATGRRWRAKE